jgi:FkbH-like protein
MYDMRGYYWTKNPFSAEGTAWLARHLWAGARALKTGPKKVAVLDLDNTLWGGVVGELGALDVALGDSPDGEAFRAFQSHLLGLSKRGVLLAVSSKNNPEDATEPFEKNPNMVLRSADFSAFEANWEPKSHSLARIAEKLRLGLDSFVFVDDSPAEREQVRMALSEVSVPDVPEEPAELVRALSASLYFETVSVTEADAARVEQYKQDQLRDATLRSFETFDDYLRSLQLRGRVEPLHDAQMLRAAQLVAKTNQFNLTNRRHDRQMLERLRTVPGAIFLTLQLADRFGDYGLIGALFALPSAEGVLDIDVWLMSCRALNRTAEHFLFGELLRQARAAGVTRLTGSYVPSSKNAQVAQLLPDLGFLEVGADADGSRRYELALVGDAVPVTHVVTE